MIKSIFTRYLEKDSNRIDRLELAKQLTESFVNDFPREKIKDLTLNEYLFAKKGSGNANSFCTRIRYEMEPLAHMGNVYPTIFEVYLKEGTILTMSPAYQARFKQDYESAFEHIKSEICALLKAADEDDFDAIANSKINSSFKYKLLMIYFPKKFFPVCAKDTLNQYCTRVGIKFNPNENILYRNLALLKWRDDILEIATWDNATLMYFCDWLVGLDISIIDSINIPMSVKEVLEVEDEILFVCGRCDIRFLKAARCPECGQLVASFD